MIMPTMYLWISEETNLNKKVKICNNLQPFTKKITTNKTFVQMSQQIIIGSK
jgi:hypothetical protein